MIRPPLGENYPTVNYWRLEEMIQGICPCCGDPYGENNPMDLNGKCHTGPVFVSYWEGFLYLTCAECKKPIVRVEVLR